MSEPNTPPRKSGRFSSSYGRSSPGTPRREGGQKPAEYYETAFGQRQYGNVPQKGDELPKAKRKRYRDMNAQEQRYARISVAVIVVSTLAGFFLCGLFLRLLFA